MLNIKTNDGQEPVEVKKILTLEGLKCFLHRNQWKTWTISEYQTGMSIAQGSTIQAVTDKATEVLLEVSSKIGDIDTWVAQEIRDGRKKSIN